VTTDPQAPSNVGEDAPPSARPWNAIRRVPSGPRTVIGSPIAAALFRRAITGLPLRVEYADGAVAGGGADAALPAPRMLIHRPKDFAARVAAGGLIGFGEAYMAGDWSAPDPAAVLTVFAGNVATLIPAALHRLRMVGLPRTPRAQRNTPVGARANIAHHYDVSNDFFAVFLDETMTYSAALFDETEPPPRWEDLADAQRRKIDRLLDHAGVHAGSRVLEIGTGWGELAIRAARRGATVRTVTLSREQQLFARQRVADAGVADRVSVALCDYRDVEGRYDAIVSVEMIEAVGYDFLPGYFRALDRLLADGGKVAIQVITMPHQRMLASRLTYTWVHKYIFPGGFLPSVPLVEQVAAGASLRIRDRFSMGPHYAHTLRLWSQRFSTAASDVDGLGFDRIFRRMWRLYLAYSEAGFRAGYLDAYQFVLDRPGVALSRRR
jgi:cyclopropane-fatty-acyl-phospholipid synthase